MSHVIHHANIKDWAMNYSGEPFDGILCDPPYELGFMGKSWDSSGIAFDVDMWKSIYDLLKPGAHLLAFSGSRTYHRMAVAIEDAGFEIRDMIEWVYGSGFPKSLNIGKAVDKIRGNEREETEGGQIASSLGSNTMDGGKANKDYKYTKGTSEWEGYGTALKPAHEPCVLARKPIEGTVANNVLKHGTGGLNIDGSRVNGKPRTTHKSGNFTGNSNKDAIFPMPNIKTTEPSGRFPANLIHDGSDEVEAVFPQTKSVRSKRGGATNGNGKNIDYGSFNQIDTYDAGFNDSGSASRFFYCAKASKSERNAGLEGFEAKEAPYKYGSIKKSEGRTGVNTPQSNHHPTVKPLSLTKYLATLIKPPTGGRLLVPFSGSGSEMIGALQAGWEHVEGVELTEEYIPIAEARIEYWLNVKEEESKQVALV